MKSIFDTVSKDCSKIVTKTYSTSFSMATKMLANSIRQDIYNIYGFVRLADEIVDSFHEYPKKDLFIKFEADLEVALKNKISLNPILNAFQHTYYKCNIDRELVDAFMNSMRLDLHKSIYKTEEEFKNYIYGSAKAGFTSYLSGLRNRLNKSNVHVLSVIPGYIDTKMIKDMNIPKFLLTSPDKISKKIFSSMNKNIIYGSFFWMVVAKLLLLIPEFIFKKLKLI